MNIRMRPTSMICGHFAHVSLLTVSRSEVLCISVGMQDRVDVVYASYRTSLKLTGSRMGRLCCQFSINVSLRPEVHDSMLPPDTRCSIAFNLRLRPSYIHPYDLTKDLLPR
jgi:hypothetical protein